MCSELSAPLSLILGYIETIQRGLVRKGPQLAQCLQVMEKHGRRMMRIVDEAMLLASLESRGSHIRDERFHVRGCITDALAHLKPRIEASQAEVEIDLPADGGVLQGDRPGWDQVFTQLIESLFDMAGGCGARLRISGKWRHDQCALTVSHSGPADPAEKQSPRPERFHMEGKSGASSLGLCIARRVVEAHGGTVELVSGPGRQARFALRMPVSAAGTASGRRKRG